MRAPPPIALAALAPLALGQRASLPEIRVDRDDVVVRRSARLVVSAPWIEDARGDGVVRVEASGIRVELAGALRGAPPDRPPDRCEGVGIAVLADDVTIAGGTLSGFRCGVLARGVDGLVVEDLELADGFRQRLRSTPRAEAVEDWLSPHENDADEWLQRYGAGIWIEGARGATVRRCRARGWQNGLVLSRARRATVRENDFSFLSGWGVALWRSSDNRIERNALDFCVRGYSHGVYNRGQDSAGLLLFEQCSRNRIVENSVTHGGDGLFCFAGREALGEVGPERADAWHERRGCNDNLILGNDFSYAAAHGVEVTFSFGNRIIANRIAGNAICGIWGGYSRGTLVARNRLEENGDAGYGLERGAVNVEHGQRNAIVANELAGNACGVHLWTDEDEAIAATPWARANGTGSRGEVVVGNRFEKDALALHVRGATGVRFAENVLVGVPEAVRGEPPPLAEAPAALPAVPDVLPPGPDAPWPIGARARLAGREHIVMTEWGPYDWERPMLARGADGGDAHAWRLLGADSLGAIAAEGEVAIERSGATGLVVRAERTGALVPYRLRVESAGAALEASGALWTAPWDVASFASEADPRESEDAWRARASGGVRFELPRLALPFGAGGPSELPSAPPALRAAGLPADGFGTLATTRVRVPAGSWRLRCVSDDGVRVRVDGELVLDDWTRHAPRAVEVPLELDAERVLTIEVAHFELDGWAVLELAIEPARSTVAGSARE